MYNVLVVGMSENPGGVESVIINYYRSINKNQIHFDFLCNTDKEIAFEKEITENGSKIYRILRPSKNYLKYKRQIEYFFKKYGKKYDAIWVNLCIMVNIDYLKYAKKYGISKRIIHSHNSKNMSDIIRGLCHKLNRCLVYKYATDFWACSIDAKNFFFNNKINEKAIIIHNAIDVNKFLYNIEKRNKIREQLGWEDKYIIGNVGRLHFQKNQEFLLNIFSELQKKDEDVRLVLVGQGEDENKLRNLAKELEIENKICFAGIQYDITGWLSAMDLFFFPSKFEGLPIAALEAQANGIPVLASDKVIPKEVKIIDAFFFFQLEKPISLWIQKIEDIKTKCTRQNSNEIIRKFNQKGFNINIEAKKLINLFGK